MAPEDQDERKTHVVPYWNSLRLIITLACCVAAIVIGIKFAVSPVSISITGFSFSEFLSLILALFAIALSLIFYLKATETSNTFYDNTYKFTANVSEILGRIEAGFSERLRHIDEGYSRLGDKFDKMPFNALKAEEQIAAEQEVVDAKQKERDALIDELLAKTRLQDDEKTQYALRLRQQEEHLAQAKNEVLLLQRRLQRAERAERAEMMEDELGERVRRFMFSIMEKLQIENVSLEDRDRVRLISRRILRNFPSSYRNALMEHGIIDGDHILSDYGYETLRRLQPIGRVSAA